MIKKENIATVLFYIAYVLLSISYICSNVSFIIPIKSLIRYSVIFVLMISLLTQARELINYIKDRKEIFVFLIILSIILGITYLYCRDAELIMTAFFLLSCKKIDIKKTIKYDCYLRIILLILVMILCKIGFAENIILYRNDGSIRQSLGLKHPNILGINILMICCDVFFLSYENKRKLIEIIKYGFVILAIFTVSYVSDSRASEICMIVLLIVDFMLHKEKFRKNINKLIVVLPVALTLLSIVCVSLYPTGHEIIMKIDKVTSTRVKCGYEFLEHYGVNLFGHYLENYGKWDMGLDLTVLDNSYLFILIEFGVIATIFILIGIFILMKYAIKKDRYEILLYLCIILFLGIMEHSIYIIFYNPMLLYLGKLLYEENLDIILRDKLKEKNLVTKCNI